MQMQLQSLHLNFSILRLWEIQKSVSAASVVHPDPDSDTKDPEIIGLLDPDPEP